MNKVIAVILLLLPQNVLGQTIISTQVKPGAHSTITPGMVCYDQDSQDKIDAALKVGIECQTKLSKANAEITALNKEKLTVENFKAVEYNPPRFYQHPLVIAGIATLVGIGLGVGIGLSF